MSAADPQPRGDIVERIAEAFHIEYERRAPSHNWPTQERSRTSWEALPIENRDLMRAVVTALLVQRVIVAGDAR